MELLERTPFLTEIGVRTRQDAVLAARQLHAGGQNGFPPAPD